MNRILFISLISVLLPICSSAQEPYEPNHSKYYIDGDYLMMCYGVAETAEPAEFLAHCSEDVDFAQYLVMGDTVIAGKEYKRVHERALRFDSATQQLTAQAEIHDFFFIREDAEGRQWWRFRNSGDELLLWDFSEAFAEGGTIKYGIHLSLYDLRNRSAVSSDSFLERSWQINKVSTETLPDGKDVQVADYRIAFGWGSLRCGNDWNDGVPIAECKDNLFLCRSHASQIMFMNDKNISFFTRLIGRDVLSLFNNWTGISKVISSKGIQSENHQIGNGKCVNYPIFDLTGRRLAAPPARGLYIEDGKVRAD